MREKTGIVAGIITFLAFSALWVWHHAVMPDPLLSITPPLPSSPLVTTSAPGAPAILPTSPLVAESPPAAVSTPTAEIGSSPPQTRTEPPLKKQPQQKNLIPSLRGKVIEFFTDSDELTPKGREALETLLPGLHSQPVQQIEIAGHTDNLGTEEYNRDLSQRRAETVKR